MTSKFSHLVDNTILGKIKDQDRVADTTFQLAAAVLMFEVVKADGDIEDEEVTGMLEILQQHFKLSDDQIKPLLEHVHAVSDKEFDLKIYTGLLLDNWQQAERKRLLQDFWSIALVDNRIDQGERETIDALAMLLELSENDIDQAQQVAERFLEQS